MKLIKTFSKSYIHISGGTFVPRHVQMVSTSLRSKLVNLGNFIYLIVKVSVRVTIGSGRPMSTSISVCVGCIEKSTIFESNDINPSVVI